MLNKRYFLLILFLSAFLNAQSENTTAFEPSMDNTIYEEGDLSNGMGEYLFAGRTASNNGAKFRRTLLKFDLTDIPANSVIDSAVLNMTMNKTIAGGTDVKIFKLVSDWGEGNSDATSNEGQGATAEDGDATWNYNFYNSTQWTNSGGDYVSTESAMTNVASTGSYEWKSEGINSDLQNWIENPSENYGWIIIGDESQVASAKRFVSRNSSDESSRPKLTVYWSSDPTSVSENNQIPEIFNLKQNYPNPFNPETTIDFRINESGFYNLSVFNLLGSKVKSLLNENLNAENYSIKFSADDLPSGIYYYRLSGVGKSVTKKMILIK